MTRSWDEGQQAEAYARVAAMRAAAAKVARSWSTEARVGHAHANMIAETIERLPLSTGEAQPAGARAIALVCRKCNRTSHGDTCYVCGERLGTGEAQPDATKAAVDRYGFVPVALEDIHQMLAECATYSRYAQMHYRALDRLMRRVDWYRRRSRAWKQNAKAAVTAANNRAADAFMNWDNGDINVSADDFAAWLRSGDPAPTTRDADAVDRARTR